MIAPLNPLKLVNTIEEVAVLPDCTFCEAGLAAMEKSGGGGGAVTVNERNTECDMLPLVPLTATL